MSIQSGVLFRIYQEAYSCARFALEWRAKKIEDRTKLLRTKGENLMEQKIEQLCSTCLSSARKLGQLGPEADGDVVRFSALSLPFRH